MYLDVKRLVTTGVGNLIDPVGYAEVLPWRRPDRTFATTAEVGAAWHKVKSDQTMDPAMGGYQYHALTDIRLDRADVEILVRLKFLANESVLRSRFQGYDGWPADAQLGLHSMAWALGPHFHFPKFEAHAARHDYGGMADECHLAGNEPRSKAQRTLFLNAKRVQDESLDREALLYAVEHKEAA